ncbi:hypothetical protein [Nostoc favosum]|uniref:Uncharacterized protein n=1 Tax=Nostoc favosum CHAB5714 TaxID=2780399 RepID=A0ABS8I722_9NOSO|nr:hypothetical protein [Nostoc favosum]MCC5599993.1 hypothetical protein [Nostoc favosum CHAB5714]
MMEQWHPKNRQYIALSAKTIALSAKTIALSVKTIALSAETIALSAKTIALLVETIALSADVSIMQGENSYSLLYIEGIRARFYAGTTNFSLPASPKAA